MALSKVYPPYQAVLDCDLCESQISVDWYCKTCPANLCQNCKKLHTTRRNFREHKVIPRSHIHGDTGGGNEKIEKGKCRTHPSHSISLICKTCGVDVCTECIVTTHNGHQFENIDARLKRSRANLGKYLQELESCETDIANAIRDVDRNMADFDKEEKNIMRHVSEARDFQMKKIEGEHTDMVKEIQKYSQNETKEMNSNKASLIKKHDQIQALIEEVRGKMSLESYADVERYQQKCPSSSSFVPDKNKTKAFTLKFQAHGSRNDRLVGKVVQEVHEKEKIMKPPKVEIVTTFTVKDAAARCVRPISPNEAWVCFYEGKKKLSLYNKSGKVHSTVQLDFSLPESFVITDKHDIIICDIGNKSITKVTSAKNIIEIKTNLVHEPHGIFINENNEPVVCLKKSVAIFTPDFKSIIHSIETNKQGGLLFRNAVAATQNGTAYAVVDILSRRVINVDIHENVLWTYAPKNFDPNDIVNYKRQILIICSSEFHELHFLNTNGDSLQIYSPGKKALSWPHSLAISPDDILWVAESCDSKKIHLLKITEV